MLQIERAPLRPGSRIHVRLVARNSSLAVSATEVRCSVWILQADVVLYPGALCGSTKHATAFWEEQGALSASVRAPGPRGIAIARQCV